jgi:hemin uptake protein HemP
MPDRRLPPDTVDAVPSPSVPAHTKRPETGARRRYISEQLFGEHTEVEIQHGESTYRLRLTSLGKLILTK